LANTFAIEGFIDELAAVAGADSLQFRLDHLDDSSYSDRIRTTLMAAAELGGYGTPLPAGRARGIAVTDYHDAIAAMVAEISVEPDGEITVHRASGAVDIGLVISPDGAVAQAQGSIVMGLSST
jgi:isoquinoline 1-oxidoreductase beta subunit